MKTKTQIVVGVLIGASFIAGFKLNQFLFGMILSRFSPEVLDNMQAELDRLSTKNKEEK